MTGPLARIILRYIGGAFLGANAGAALASDPDVQAVAAVAVGVALSAAAEGWYWAARRFGWAK